MFRAIVFLCISLFVGCSNNANDKSVVLNYDAFGPQVIASEVIGMQWWQWQAHGDSTQKNYDIKVVVYKDVSIESIEKQYPVDSNKENDFRYLEYQAAIRYLDEKINDDVIESTTERLKETKMFLVSKLGN